jgi:hypothetical protein
VRNAIGLMYAGAAYTLLYAVGVAMAANTVVTSHPAAAARAAAGRVSVGGVVAVIFVLALIEIALWLGIAWACRNGRSGGRTAGTVLFGAHTVGLLGVLLNAHPGLGPAKILTLLSWLIGGGAVLLLWQRASGAFFAGRPHSS